MSRPAARKIAGGLPYICPQCRHHQVLAGASRRTIHTSLRMRQQQQKQPSNSSVLDLLEQRGYINQIAGDRNTLHELLRRKRISFYAGIDPTAPSLHLGHLLPLMLLFWISIHGHTAVSLIGGGTARVGDPSGRLTTRAYTDESVQRSNAQSMFAQTTDLWKNVRHYAARYGYAETQIGQHRLLDNGHWLDSLNILDFLKTLGNGMRLGTMLGRDTVRNKMEKGDGMSFSEFTYPLLQAWDWWHMYSTMDVQIQVGGSDQYGNIVAGMDAVRYIGQAHHDSAIRGRFLDSRGRLRDDLAPMGLTVPLLTTASGEKFGKSAGNAIWLDRTMTSPFDLYGFLLRSSDADVERYLNLFTFVPSSDIGTLMVEHNTDPGKRKAQHLLASEVLELVHGREEAIRTRSEHEAARNPVLSSYATSSSSSGQAAESSSNPGNDRIRLPQSQVWNMPFARILYNADLVSSKSEGARLVAKGGLYVASKPIDGGSAELVWTQIKDQKPEDFATLLTERILMLRIGKWKVRVIEVVPDEGVVVRERVEGKKV